MHDRLVSRRINTLHQCFLVSCLCFFPFDVSGGRCGIIVSIPDHCLPFYFVTSQNQFSDITK